MRRLILLSLFAAVLAAAPAAQQNFADLSQLLDFDATLEAVNRDGTLLDSLVGEERLVLFTGTIASRKVVNGDEADFIGELELIDGEWHGTESVSVYKSYLRLEGPEYFEAIPQRRSREENPNEIKTNTRYLVVGAVVGVRETDEGRFPVLKVSYLREI